MGADDVHELGRADRRLASAASAQVTARDDVNAEVLANDPMLSFMAEEVLPLTHYRPSLAEYPQVSVALQEAVESVVTGTSPEDAPPTTRRRCEEIVGADAVNGG